MATINGTQNNDTLTSGSAADILNGLEGNDSLVGAAGNDSLFGGLGDDTLNGGTGSDLNNGDDGFDIADYSGSNAAVVIDLDLNTASGGWAAGDTLTNIEGLIGSIFNDSLSGDIWENLLIGGAGNDFLFGFSGDDTLIGGAGADSMDGSLGNDWAIYSASLLGVNVNLATGNGLLGDAAGDRLFGIENVIGTNLGDTILGGDEFNNLIGAGGGDRLTGGNGEDTLNGGLGADTLDGGADIDVVDYSTATAAIAVNLGSGTGSAGEAAGDVISNVENVFGTAFGDTITGNADHNTFEAGAGNDQLYGGAGNDSMFGGAGNDTFYGDAGGDSIEGGDGFDILTYATSATAVNVNLALNFHTLGDAQNDRIRGIEHLVGSAFNDVLTGDSFDKVLAGGAGDDTLNGGIGNDTLIGGTGNDVYLVNSLFDVTDEAGGGGTDLVQTSVSFTASAGVENMILLGNLDIDATGNELNNVLTGNTGGFIAGSRGFNRLFGMGGNDTLLGNGGADTLDGGTGNDSMVGGADGDTYYVDATGDVVVELDGGGVDHVMASITYTVGTFVEFLTLTGTAAINGTGGDAANIITGNVAANVLTGNAGNDTLNGAEGNDTLNGGIGVDSMTGGIGDDVYLVDNVMDRTVEAFGGGYDRVNASISHTLSANIEDLTLTGSVAVNGIGNADANVINGNGIGNLLQGWNGNDTLNGNGGNDTLDGGDGLDSLSGGAGDDLYYVNLAGEFTRELAGQGIDTVQTGLNWTLEANVENLIQVGTASAIGIGNAEANVLTGNSGSNLLQGLDGIDTLYGGAGLDTLDGGTGADSMVGGLGNDVYVVDSVTDAVVEAVNEGIDTVQTALTLTLALNVENLTQTGIANTNGTGNTVGNFMLGNGGNNRLTGLEGNDSLYGGAGNDTLLGGVDNDLLSGGAGDDTFVIGEGIDLILESFGGGIDTVQSTITHTLTTYVENLTLTGTGVIDGTGNTENNVITGNTKVNKLMGLGGNDTLYGGNGADTLDGGTGNDSMEGGASNDLYIVDAVADVVLELAGEGADTVQSAVNYTLGANIEALVLLGSQNLTGTGSTGNDVLTGNTGANILSGLEGNDTLDGGFGADTLDGGTGIDRMSGGANNDVFIVDAAGDLVIEVLNEGIDRVQSTISYTLTANVENLTLIGADVNGTGNELANILLGTAGNNSLSGNDGNDTITADAGNDTLNGGLGADSMTGGLGDDLYIVDNIGDRVVDVASGGTDTIQSSVSYTLVSFVEVLNLVGSADITGTGTTENNTIVGNTGSNLLLGGGGNDTLTGGAGNDTLDGGTGNDALSGGVGNDVYIVDSAFDTITEGAAGNIDEVRAAITYTLANNLEHLTLTGSTNTLGTGNTLANRIVGNTGSNQLFGGAGDDTLDGGNGYDTLNGGAGADDFLFTTPAIAYDVISDFNALDGGAAEGDQLVFAAGLLRGTFSYVGSGTFTGGSDNTEARVVGNAVLVDWNGDTVVDFNIQLTGLTSAAQISASDFVFL